ncbi:choice-of-anchor P family protein [Streptomyces fulvoviolaceus]|uniref:choice-of-anchor P family protein n=1 Tax=Streptomyces fulvoviolaceus TaxID=285535 RepID=UPI0021C092D9|nr:choice-of-anchor P family protein [Streptomyces fulvoviolaceus]MCT9083739.1 peptidoglycan DD-metalloendopeptidase family protein [Streptomyces fulvoviolaceus]
MRARMAMVLGAALTALALGAPPASADPDNPPDFKAPFECGQTWEMYTRDGHGGNETEDQQQLDMERVGGETEGSAVLAAADGEVYWEVSGGDDGSRIGINIKHDGGWFSQYLHMSEYVEVGTKVKQGDRIGTASNAGTTVPHLHYQEMYDSDGDGSGEENELVYPYLEGKEYRITPEDGRVSLTSTNNCDGSGDPGDPGEPEPEPEKTKLAYTGDTSLAGGDPAELSAVLTEEESGNPVADQKVSFTLGADDSAQACEGTTDAEGTATCTIEEVDQPLTDDATVPVTAAFAGDDAYEPSEAPATLDLRYVTGRAYGLSAEVPLPLIPIGIDPTPDTGAVRTADAGTTDAGCAEQIEAIVLSAGPLCADVVTKTGPNSSTATATVADARIGLTGLPVVEVTGLTAESSSTCSASKGSVGLTLSIGGTPVEIPDTPNHSIDLGAGAKLVVNEQIPVEGADQGLTVNAVHLTALGGADVVLGSSTSGAFNC